MSITLTPHFFVKSRSLRLQSLVVILLLMPGTNSQAIDLKEHPVSSPTPTETESTSAELTNDNSGLTMSAGKQAQAGIKTQAPEFISNQTEFQATATVVDIQPLLNLRQQFLNALAEQQGALAAQSHAEKALNRTAALYRNGINSQRQLQELELQLSNEKARLSASRFRLQSLDENLLAQWGKSLGNWAKATNSAVMLSFINAQQALLLVTLPSNRSLPENLSQIVVEPSGNRQQAKVAHFISKAPYGSEISQGETYFFETPKTNLRTGMRLSAWLSESGKTLSGFRIPASALIWHAGQANVYLKVTSERFVRFPLKAHTPIAGGYFVAESLPAKAEIVITGAQLLLSQELSANIPKEDDEGD